MDLTPYINLRVTFDLTGAPKIILEDVSAYPPGVAAVMKGWLSIKHPDGINLNEGSVNGPNIVWDGSGLPAFEKSLRLGTDQKFQRGTYIIVYNVLYDNVLTTQNRTFEINYQEVTIDLEKQFDTFTPSLKIEDKTNYTQSLYTTTASTVAWSAVSNAGIPAGTANVFDLIIGGNYYNSLYQVSFTRNLTYAHNTYPYLFVLERYTKNYQLYPELPPTTAQIITFLNTIRDRYVAATGCTSNAAAYADYVKASVLLFHFFKKVCAAEYTGASDILAEFMLIYYAGVTTAPVVDDTVIAAWDPTGACSGSGSSVPVHILSITNTMINNWNAAFAALPPEDVDVVVGIDGDAPAAGQNLWTLPSFQNWRLRIHLNRLKQTFNALNPDGTYWTKAYSSDTVEFTGLAFYAGDLVQAEHYRTLEDVTVAAVEQTLITEDGQGILDETNNPIIGQ